MNHNILVLALCQAMLITSTSLLISTSALIGSELAADPVLATVPLGLQFLAMMLSSFPASFLMKQFGRRAGFMTGGWVGIAGAGLCTYSIISHSFIGFCCGSILLGVVNGIGQFYRFAAADAATADYRSRAISWVLAGGVAAAFLGPNLAIWTRNILAVPFAGSYTALIGVYLITLLLLTLLRIAPPSEQERHGSTRALSTIACQPVFIVAVITAMVGYGVMNLVMTATPLAMTTHQHPFADAAFVIQWHILGMFVPSFFTGHLIKRYGILTVMLCGGLLLMICILINFSGNELIHFWTALVLLGIGWNFLYIGATALVTETYAIAEKAKAQALNDFLVFGTVTLTAFSSGALQHAFGWQAVNAGVIPLVLVAIGATVWLSRQRARADSQLNV